MRHFDELEFDEIGRRLKIPKNTVKTVYYRSLEKLRLRLRPLVEKEKPQ